MTQSINEQVSVTLVSDIPTEMSWKNRVYKIEKIGLHHTYLKGKTLYHVFSVTTSNLFLRLILNTDNLLWHLEEISDGF